MLGNPSFPKVTVEKIPLQGYCKGHYTMGKYLQNAFFQIVSKSLKNTQKKCKKKILTAIFVEILPQEDMHGF